MIFAVRTLVPGRARGRVAAIAPLSFWGGYHAASGTIVDRSHPDFGRTLQGRILLMTTGRGSSSSSSVLAEAIRLGTAPAAIVLAEADSILAVGAMVAATLYNRACPIVVLTPSQHAVLKDAAAIYVEADADLGRIVLTLQ